MTALQKGLARAFPHLKKKLLATALVILFFALGFSCPMLELLGIPCPGCGMTRAWRALLRLDLSAAFRAHPMFWSAPALYLAFLRDGQIIGRRFPDRLFLILCAIGFGANWVRQLLAL